MRVGHHGLFAAYTYLVGGGHAFDDLGRAVVDQERTSKGIVLGDNVWLGAGATVLDGVEIGRDVVVGAGAVVTTNLPEWRYRSGGPGASGASSGTGLSPERYGAQASAIP